MGFKTATSSGRSVQIASNSVSTYRGPVAIDVFSSLIFTLSVTEGCAKLMHISRSIVRLLHATRVPFSQFTIKFDNFFVFAHFSALNVTKLAVRNCFCLTQAVSLCGRIKRRRRRLLTLPDDRTKLTDPSEWLQ